MLYAFGFERVGVVVADLYFDNPRAARGQEGELGRPPHGEGTDVIRTGWL
jgi:hypothetical protein